VSGEPRFQEIFFEIFEGLPRQGPGNRASLLRALALCRDLPDSPTIIDLGCGVGGQTLQLAEVLPSASIVAVDSHAPSIRRLKEAASERGIAGRLSALAADMARLELQPGSFDLAWSEGALYNLGLAQALRLCHELLRPGGYLAFSDSVWRRDDPPPELTALFESEYPTMGTVEDDLAAIRASGLELQGHFTLPDEAWWDDFYTPMERRIAKLRLDYAHDPEALAALDQLAEEPDNHRRNSAFYAYEFFVARRPTADPRG
jgi:SAM-dependent methyltransferase